jgi:hypothetical protein
MKKKIREDSLKISDFFGTYNVYHIFTLQSELSDFTFVNQLGKSLQTNFTILPDLVYDSPKFSAKFSVFYAEFSQEESIHFLLLENKTVNFNQTDIFISKTEKKLPFQTLSLFEEWLYLFNNQGIYCFDLAFDDADWLLLLYAKKDIENDIFSKILKKTVPFKAKDISYLIEREQTAAEAKTVAFLRDFYCKYEVQAAHFSKKRKMDILAPVKHIPKKNLLYPIPILLENNAIADSLHLSEENLVLLSTE